MSSSTQFLRMVRLEHITSESEEPLVENLVVDVSRHFDGKQHFNFAEMAHYINPGEDDVEAGATNSSLHRHRDLLNRVTYKPKDLLRYLNPDDAKPKRMLVQATPQALAQPAGDWRRVKMKGAAPSLLRLSSWVLKEIITKKKNEPYTATMIGWVALKVLIVSPIQLILVTLPMGSGGSQLWYDSAPVRSWDYPTYTRNPLDAQPRDSKQGHLQKSGNRSVLNSDSNHARQLRPRRLVVLQNDGQWDVIIEKQENHNFDQEDPDQEDLNLPYLFVSFRRAHFDCKNSEKLHQLHRIAAQMTERAGLRAYWLDHYCIEQRDGPKKTEDIHRICDVVRGAYQLVVAVPNLHRETLAEWGKRVWTLSEALLSRNKMIRFCAIDPNSADGHIISIEKQRVSLAKHVWGEDQAGRMLAEHFSGQLTLSRLELISFGLQALSDRDTGMYSEGDRACALMGLMGQRPQVNIKDTQFQALARLSLANDSDRIVERMMCMLPDKQANDYRSNKKFVLKDELGAKLWDIEPTCQVAGVCDGSAVILDGCRGASIWWRDIPKIQTVRRSSYTRSAITVGLRSGGVLLVIAVFLLAFGQKVLGALLLPVGLLLLLSSPWSINILYAGKIWGAEPRLIGFEGIMPINELETMVFGNATKRLSYAPSSSLLACRDENERIGKEPDWVTSDGFMPHIPPGQRLFTLLDTGTLTVSLFTAEKPPSVALITGREGGMLRVVLCHYERSTGTLHKQTVLRMETPMIHKTGLLGWVKVA